ncbi:ring-cleaving dioxygenase (plasmid) [Paroceanicella profunda]|uniref:Ring-cleaving dioxygenase n=1 Tax=Paroceanicella profunda TaxID=2579971 RepID=A0A5B8FJH5_9RHOB|nr:ring-cleaving dioxygenase [Paroceanicella profunda]QDL94328.1 ring-cleaving dioxygenase [Paroceanicella profunda]
MDKQINGLHHVTSIASSAQANSDFFTKTLGLRRVKKTVNFDSPDTYHLYYGDAAGTPGSVMTYFPFRGVGRGRPGTGEVGTTVFSVPEGSLGYWKERLGGHGVTGLAEDTLFGERRLRFDGPDGDGFALAEIAADARPGWTGSGVTPDEAVRGFRGATLRLRDGKATGELLEFMGYDRLATEGDVTRYAIAGGNGADTVDVEVLPGADRAQQGAGSVHHIAFSVPDRAAQLAVRQSLMDTGYQVTPVIDRDYFWAIYFRTPGGVLFEVATAEPGFDRDEAPDHLGEALKLPHQHERLRAQIEAYLDPIAD